MRLSPTSALGPTAIGSAGSGPDAGPTKVPLEDCRSSTNQREPSVVNWACRRETPGSAEQSIETAFATPEEAALLTSDPALPTLLMFRHTWDRDGAPLEWVRSVYRGDRYKLVAHLSRPEDRA